MANIVIDRVGQIIVDDPDAISEPEIMHYQIEEIKPQDGGQTDFMQRPEFEVLYGGAAGGGKSWSLMFDAMGIQFEEGEFGMRAIDHPDYRAVIFRRETPHLAKLIDIGKDLYCRPGVGAEYMSETEPNFVLNRKGDPGASFNFPSGAKIFLCHLERENDKENHQGLEYQYIGFDELTQFLITQYLYLFSRCRGVVESYVNTGVFLPNRIRSTTNPTGEGLVWVRKRFIKNSRRIFLPGVTSYFIADPDAEQPIDNPTGIEITDFTDPRFKNAKSRTFIPGLLSENKILMEADPGYAANIMQLGAKMERALVDGDWDAFGGDFFDMLDVQGAKEKPFDISERWELVGALDPGWSSPCCFILAARDHDRQMHVLFTYYSSRKDPETHAKNIYKLIKEFPFTKGRMPDIIVAGTDAWAKKNMYSVNRTELTFADIFRDNGLLLQQATTDRKIGWWALKQYMVKGMFHYLDGLNDDLIDELTALQTDEDDVDDISGKGNDASVIDHASDTIRYLTMALPYPFKTKADLLPAWAYKKWYKTKGKLKSGVMSK